MCYRVGATGMVHNIAQSIKAIDAELAWSQKHRMWHTDVDPNHNKCRCGEC